MEGNSINIPTSFFGLNRHDVRQYIQNLLAEEEEHIKKPAEVKKQLEKSKERLLAELKKTEKVEERHEKIIRHLKPKVPDAIIVEANKRLKKTTSQINVLVDEEARNITEKANNKLAEYEITLDRLQETILENKSKIDLLLGDVLKVLKSNLNEEGPNESINDKEQTKEIVLQNDREIEIANEAGQVAIEGASVDFLHNLFALKKRPLTKIDDGNEYNDFSYNEEYFDYENEVDDADRNLKTDKKTDVISIDIEDSKKTRNSFIIGKIAGDDIFDSNSNIVVNKGKILNEDDIILAEKESKLPELIVNMVMPK